MRSGSSSWPGVSGSVSLLARDPARVVGACVVGVCVCVPGASSLLLLGKSVLGARRIWAVVTLCLAAAAAAAAPVAPLATEGAGPAEAVLPAGAAMGRGSHGECTVGVSPFPPMRFIVVVLGLEVLYVCGLGCSAAPDVGAHGECITGASVFFFLGCFSLALAICYYYIYVRCMYKLMKLLLM